MDHREVIAALTPEERRDLTRRSDMRGLAHLVFHFGAILVFGALIAAGLPFWPLLLLPQGILIVFLFTLLHETVHRTAFETQRLNDIAARVCSVAVMLPADWFRYFHFAHHRFTQDPDNDPELASAKPETMREYVLHVSGIPLWWSLLKTLVNNALGRCRDDFVPEKGREAVISEARWMIGVYAVLMAGSIALESTLLVWVWAVPALLGQPFLRLYLLAEHGRCPFVANMLENTRTTLTNRLVKLVAWNMPYHAEHHAYPAVPFHRLPEFHEIVKDRIVHTEHGYARFHQGYLGDLR